jgi:tetratricopeptide (TPR) repeat protein
MSFPRALRLLAVVVVAAGLPPPAIGQGRGSSNRTSIAPPSPPGGNQVTLMLSGNVITEDGSPLPGPASIERVCSGRVSRDGRSDFKGYFTVSIAATQGFQFGDPEGSAETGGGSGLTTVGTIQSRTPQNPSALASALAGCELRASLAGFHSSSLAIPQGGLGTTVGAVNVGTIVLQSMQKVQGVTVSATSLNAPKDAKKAYDKGHHAIENNKLPEAQQELEKAVQLYPQYAAAWQDLGWVYAQQDQLDKARNAFTQAQAADGMFVPAFVGLSSVAVRESKWAEAADLSARATLLDGVDFPAAFYYNSLANYRLGNLEQAEVSARKAETLGAQRSFPQVSLLLGVMLANRQEYAEAAEHLRAYLKAAPTAPNAEKVRQQLAEVEKLGVAPVKAEATPPAK